ncbi:MAG: MATE family efflux transporter [Bacteroides sp.]|nr:MATE family efflux transporter [Bacteroides sp.]
MTDTAQNDKRIAKNTLLLYFRMLLIMAVNLYTVRVVLKTLGAVDYGLYNVVGGIVMMFGFLSGTMASASQRFFAFELGRKNYVRLKQTFSMTMTIYLMIGAIILLLAETIGLYFLNTQMTIPPERMEAAKWVYQFSILSFMMTMFTVPYNASIIAHERMNVYAYVSIIEAVLKLLIVYLLVAFLFDKLKLYAILTFSVTTLVTFIYRTYCNRKFEECRFSFYWEKTLFREIVSYSGWNLFGALASVFNNQGVGIVLNLFFGPLVNAAQAIAYQVNNAINQFVQNFMTAVRPQIIKYYAANEKKQMLKLVFQSSKFSFLLLFILTMPILLETNFILEVWLKNSPQYVVLFTRLIIVSALIDSLSYPLMTVVQATGKVKKYQSSVGGMMLLNLPLSYLFLKLGYPAQTVFYLAILNSITCLFLRLILLRKMIDFPIMNYIQQTIIPLLLIAVFSYAIPYLLVTEMNKGFIRFFVVGLVGLISTGLFIYIMGLSKDEKQYINSFIKKIKHKYLL